MPKIKVTVDTMGGTVVETTGYRGKECTEATRQIERAMGKVTSDKKTVEYHKREQARLKGRA